MIKEDQVIEYLATHSIGAISSVYNNKPFVATIRFGTDGLKLYFASLKDSTKARNIIDNPKVALAIDNHQTDDFIQYNGEARVLSEESEIEIAIKALTKVYKYAKYWISASDVLFFEVKPTLIKYTDGSQRCSKKYFGDVHVLRFEGE